MEETKEEVTSGPFGKEEVVEEVVIDGILVFVAVECKEDQEGVTEDSLAKVSEVTA